MIEHWITLGLIAATTLWLAGFLAGRAFEHEEPDTKLSTTGTIDEYSKW